MPNRIQPKETTRDAPGLWTWLKHPDNQKTLRFVGASLAAAIGVLVTMGVIHKPDDKTPPAQQPTAVAVAPSAQPSQPPAQSAVANNGGTATVIQGSGNKVENGQ